MSARTGSLTLPVAKTRSGAEEPTVPFALCRTIALHGPSHGTYICLKPRRMEKHMSPCEKQRLTVAQMDTHACAPCSGSEHVHSYGNICPHARNICDHVCCYLHNSFSHCLSHGRSHTHKARRHTPSHCTLCTLPMPVFSCSQMERGSRSFFTNLLILPPQLFFFHLHPLLSEGV